MIENIITFLESRGWSIVKQTKRFIELSPPAEFDINEGFRIHVPVNIDRIDANNFLDNLLEIISDFYSLTVDDLSVLLKADNSVLKVRLYDKETEEGKIPLIRFEELVDRIKQILSDTASFVIDQSVTSTRTPDEVARYLNLCNFMQTERGSFIAKIQLPSKELIKDKELFDREEVYSEDINNKLIEVMSFVNDNILEGEVNVTEEYLIENENRINIKLFKNIHSLYQKVDIKGIDFSVHNKKSSTTISNSNITKQKLYKLNNFVEQIEANSFEIDNFSFSGIITTLKSNDPDGLKNNVTFIALHDNMPIVVAATLNSEHYKEAIEAHKLKQNIMISGLAKKTKTRARFIEITDFTIEK